jgi:chemotaxis signal transduction protein
MSDEELQVNDSLDVMGEIEDGTEQFLTFILGDEEYGVEILRVQEIKGWDTVTNIPNSPHYLCGVLNLRGSTIKTDYITGLVTIGDNMVMLLDIDRLLSVEAIG